MERPSVLRAVRLGAALSLLAVPLSVPVPAAAAGADAVLLDDEFDDGALDRNDTGVGDGWVIPEDNKGASIEETDSGALRFTPTQTSWLARVFTKGKFEFRSREGMTIHVKARHSPITSPYNELAVEKRSIFLTRGEGTPAGGLGDSAIGLHLTLGENPQPEVCIYRKDRYPKCVGDWSYYPSRDDWDGVSEAEITWWLNDEGYEVTINDKEYSAKQWPEGFVDNWVASSGNGDGPARLLLQSSNWLSVPVESLGGDRAWNIERVGVTRGRDPLPADKGPTSAGVRRSGECNTARYASITLYGGSNCTLTVEAERNITLDPGDIIPTDIVPDAGGGLGVIQSGVVGRLPAGLELDSAGVLSGTPTTDTGGEGVWLWIYGTYRTANHDAYFYVYARLVVEETVAVSDACVVTETESKPGTWNPNVTYENTRNFGLEGCRISVPLGVDVEIDLPALVTDTTPSQVKVSWKSELPAGLRLDEDGVIRGKRFEGSKDYVSITLTLGNEVNGKSVLRQYAYAFDLVVE